MDKPNGDASAEQIVQEKDPVAQLPGVQRRQCNGARLGKRREQVEALILEGQPKQRVARILNISPHVVRAVARQMDAGELCSPLREDANVRNETSRTALPDLLRERATAAINAISASKLEKSSAHSLALVGDRLLARAESLENHRGNVDFLATVLDHYGVQPSHSASRVTLEQKITVESQAKPSGGN